MIREVGSRYSLAIIGGGRMGEAIAAGLITSGTIDPASMVVVEPAEARRTVFERMGMRAVADGHDDLVLADAVLLAVKPQVIDVAVAHYADDLAPDTLVISIAAGITTARLEALLTPGTPVVRVMPNTPAMVGEGMAVVSGGSVATDEHVERVRALFEAVGDALVLDEAQQDAATAISGSGPAYMALFVDALAEAGAAQGLDRATAERLAVRTLGGTAALLEASGMTPAELIAGVSSPGGTTVAALQVLEGGGLRQTVATAVEAAVRRAKELGS